VTVGGPAGVEAGDIAILPAAAAVFGPRLPLARAFVHRLATEGLTRGLLGPREVPRLWERHVLNCAVLADLLPAGVEVVDVGSGAGLPGIVLAVRRPDLRVTLLEPMQRRVAFLVETVAGLELGDTVRVLRGRAEDSAVRQQVGPSDYVTARAVAPLDRLVEWCLPLVRPGGRLLALKGARAAEEVASAGGQLRRWGAGEISVAELGRDLLPEPTWVVEVQRSATGARVPNPTVARPARRKPAQRREKGSR
jgi:16S rRNA (guanine527-N7)-methyltransferase